MRKSTLMVFMLGLLWFALQTTSEVAQPAAAQAPAKPQANYQVYLPLVVRAPAPTPTPQPIKDANFFLPYLFDNNIYQNVVPQVAIDPAGAVHLVYAFRGGGGIYGYCATNCISTDKFTLVNLGSGVSALQLALDAAGHPRVLYEVAVTGGVGYGYGECNANCTSNTGWLFTDVLAQHTGLTAAYVQQRRSFALDPQGRPRFAYWYSKTNGEQGTFLASCNAACTTETHWTTTRVTDEAWDQLSLAFTPSGLPRLAAVKTGSETNYQDWLIYIECATVDCTTSASAAVVVGASSAGVSPNVFALRMDANGHPRIAYYPGSGDGGTLLPQRLYYLSCDANCAVSDQSWSMLDMGLPSTCCNGSIVYNGEMGVDLVFDAQNRPRVAFRVSLGIGEVGYAWCNNNCTQSAQGWQGTIIPSKVLSDQELGHIRTRCENCNPPLPDCQSTWSNGMWPSLTLDASGNPYIVFEAQLWTFGGCSSEAVARLSRLVSFKQP